MIRVDSHDEPCLLHLVHLDLTAVIAAVSQCKPKTVSVFFRRHLVAQYHKRIVLMAGHAALALY